VISTKLRAKIPTAIRAYSRELTEEKAMNLLEEHGPKKDDRDYQPPADQAPIGSDILRTN
jgi:hypothetical protein